MSLKRTLYYLAVLLSLLLVFGDYLIFAIHIFKEGQIDEEYRWILFVVGFLLIYIFILIITHLKGWMRTRWGKNLIKNRIEIIARFDRIIRDKKYKVRGRNPYQLVAKGKMHGKLHTFKSQYLWKKPQKHQLQRDVVIYVNEDNPQKYYMDISFLK